MVGLNTNIASTVASLNTNGAQRANSNSTNETNKTENRVETLKKQIASGEYKFDLDKTAQKLAEALS